MARSNLGTVISAVAALLLVTALAFQQLDKWNGAVELDDDEHSIVPKAESSSRHSTRRREHVPSNDGSHVKNKALQEAQDAVAGLSGSDDGGGRQKLSSAQEKHRLKMLAKMKKLQAQITKDFHKVTAFGHKAGYLPPIKMPNMR